MKFDLVLRKLWTILLDQEIREPNHADHLIGQRVTSNKFSFMFSHFTTRIQYWDCKNPTSTWYLSVQVADETSPVT